MASRSFIIPLEVDRPDPENRVFRHSDPYEWTLQSRAKILRSLYTVLIWGLQRRLNPGEQPPPKTRFKRWWTLCGAPVEALAGVDFAAILNARENEDSGVSAMAALLSGLYATFGEKLFTAQDVDKLDTTFGSPTEDETWTRSPETLLEEATGKPMRRPINAQQIGKRLQMVVGRPAEVDSSVLKLERFADPRNGNKYRVKRS
jgi:hypothetical protein